MFPNSWVSGPALVSGTLDRYLRIALLAEYFGVIAGIFLLYCWYFLPDGEKTPLQFQIVRIGLGLFGGSGALGAVFLSEAMWNYWRQYDRSSNNVKRYWNWIMVVFVAFGCTAYYHLVYKSQINRMVTSPDGERRN